MADKTFIFHYEGAIDIDAKNKEEAWEKLEQMDKEKLAEIVLTQSEWKNQGQFD